MESLPLENSKVGFSNCATTSLMTKIASASSSFNCVNLKGRVVEEKGRNKLQTDTLLDTIEANEFDCCIGGARRDEEKARAKERFFSHRDEFGQWIPKDQRPELWNIFNGRKNPGEHFWRGVSHAASHGERTRGLVVPRRRRAVVLSES
jgi:hypothetical protein